MTRNINVSAILAIIVTVICSSALGFALCSGSITEIRSISVFSSCTSISSIRDAVLSVGASTALQGAIIFISAYTLFCLPICLSVLAFRSVCLMYMITASSGILGFSSFIPFGVAYAVITALLSYLTYKSVCVGTRLKRHKMSFKGILPDFLHHTYVFLTINATCIIIKLVPHLILLRQ